MHRAGPEQGDLHGQVVENLGLQLAHQLHLPGRLQLVDAEGASGADQLESGQVVQRHPVAIDPLARQDPVLLGGKGNGRLHAHVQEIELDQAHRVHVVLVELGHRQPHPGRLYRGAPAETRPKG